MMSSSRGNIENEVRRGDLLPLKGNTPEVLAATRKLLLLTDEMLGILTELEEFGDGWPFDLRAKCRQFVIRIGTCSVGVVIR